MFVKSPEVVHGKVSSRTIAERINKTQGKSAVTIKSGVRNGDKHDGGLKTKFHSKGDGQGVQNEKKGSSFGTRPKLDYIKYKYGPI